jgi:hypothetical protein
MLEAADMLWLNCLCRTVMLLHVQAKDSCGEQGRSYDRLPECNHLIILEHSALLST